MDRMTVAELGTLSIPELYRLHQTHDATVVAIRQYHADINAQIIAKEQATVKPGNKALAQVLEPGTNIDLAAQIKALPAELQAKLRNFFTGGKN